MKLIIVAQPCSDSHNSDPKEVQFRKYDNGSVSLTIDDGRELVFDSNEWEQVLSALEDD